MKVSVVVPVYNAGEYLQPCIDSLLEQSLPPDELELVFVDDGSTDDSLARLRAFAVERANVVVLTIPNSGWPGRPRNVGTDAASGEYVMYVDQDDVLEPEALERMYAYGSEHDADVILGKVISDFRGVHHYLYRENRPHCTVYTAHLMGSQTPHKMLRTEFLRRHHLRFPEGRRRLEDQYFITSAYFAASSVAIVSDYVCYRYLQRPDRGNAGSSRISPATYYDNLREVLDVVEANTEPGTARDGFYRRFLKTEMLGRLGGRKLFNAPAHHRPELLREIRTLMAERFTPQVIAGLPAALRVRAALVQTGDVDDLIAFAHRMSEVRPSVTLTGVSASAAGGVDLGVSLEFSYAGSPLNLERSGEDWLLPRDLVGPKVSDADRTVEPLTDMLGDVVIRHRELLDEWFLPGGLRPRLETTKDGARLIWCGTGRLDPDRAAGGAPLRRGVHDLVARVDAFGINRTLRFGAHRAHDVSESETVVLGDLRSILYSNRGGNFSLRVGASKASAAELVVDGTRSRIADRRLTIDLPVAWSSVPERLSARLRPLHGGGTKTVRLLPAGGAGGDRWVSSPRALAGLEGECELQLPLGSLGKVVLSTVRLRAAEPPGNFVERSLRAAGRRLPSSLVTRLSQSRTLSRLRGRQSKAG